MTPDQYREQREKLGLTQAGLAAMLGVTRETINKREAGTQRIIDEMALALERVAQIQRPNVSLVDWEHVDWRKSTTRLAADLGIHQTTISARRRRHAPHTVGHGRPKGIDWSAVDWSASTTEIARTLKVRLSRVSDERRKYAPHTVRARGPQNTAVSQPGDKRQSAVTPPENGAR